MALDEYCCPRVDGVQLPPCRPGQHREMAALGRCWGGEGVPSTHKGRPLPYGRDGRTRCAAGTS